MEFPGIRTLAEVSPPRSIFLRVLKSRSPLVFPLSWLWQEKHLLSRILWTWRENNFSPFLLSEEEANIEYDHVINLQVSEEEVIRRLTARGRADDKPEIIKNRLKVYHRETAPLLTYYKDEIINIKAEGSTPEKISKEIIGKIQ